MSDRPKVGDRVKFNNLPDAVEFTVKAIDGTILEIVESGTDFATQRVDVCCVAVIIKDAKQ